MAVNVNEEKERKLCVCARACVCVFSFVRGHLRMVVGVFVLIWQTFLSFNKSIFQFTPDGARAEE